MHAQLQLCCIDEPEPFDLPARRKCSEFPRQFSCHIKTWDAIHWIFIIFTRATIGALAIKHGQHQRFNDGFKASGADPWCSACWVPLRLRGNSKPNMQTLTLFLNLAVCGSGQRAGFDSSLDCTGETGPHVTGQQRVSYCMLLRRMHSFASLFLQKMTRRWEQVASLNSFEHMQLLKLLVLRPRCRVRTLQG